MTGAAPAVRGLVKSAAGAARFRLTGRRVPLSVTLVLTHRCNSSCAPCAVPLQVRPELEAAEWLALVDHLARLGTTRIVISGGEPLLRPDLAAIVDRCAEHGMWTVLETNGHELPAHAASLGHLDRVMVALHGPREVHDAIVEPGAFDKAVAGIEAARAAGLRVGTVTLLARSTIDTVGWVLDFADEAGTEAVFQIQARRGWVASRGARRELADDDALRRTIRLLLEARIAGRRVAMTEKLLRSFLTWPDLREPFLEVPHEDVRCMAGQTFCTVSPDGLVSACLPRGGGTGNVRESGFDAAFAALRDGECRSCTDTACAEANFLYNLNTPVVLELARAGLRSRLGSAA
jgi:MoaA/NifB/PqqE/SkfB family radical SAM enzyme